MDETEQTNEKNFIGNLVKVGTPFDAESVIQSCKEAIMGGHVDPLAVYTVLKRMNKVAETVFEDKEIQKVVNDEADKHLSGSTKSFKLYSATICKMAVYTWYDFTGCNHPEWEQLKQIKEQVEARMKLIEEELKLLIPKKDPQMGMGIAGDTKTIVIEKMPVLNWLENEDQVIVKAPQKMQKIGLKFLKI